MEKNAHNMWTNKELWSWLFLFLFFKPFVFPPPHEFLYSRILLVSVNYIRFGLATPAVENLGTTFEQGRDAQN